MKEQKVIAVRTSDSNPLEYVNAYLEQFWYVKKVIVIRENLIHYVLERDVPNDSAENY